MVILSFLDIIQKIKSFLTIENRILFELELFELEKIYDKIKPYVKDTISINVRKSSDRKIKLGSSKIGGAPDLPKNMDWPKFEDTYLTFIAQLNFSEIKKYDKENLLPENGILYFFLSYSKYVDEMQGENEDKTYKVIYYSGELKDIERKNKPKELVGDDNYGVSLFFKTGKIIFENNITFPSQSSYIYEKLKLDLYLTDEEQARYFDLLYFNSLTRIFGFPFLVQNEIWLEEDENEYIILFQIAMNQDLDMYWGDGGVNCFYLSKESLKLKQFEYIYYDYQCG